MKLFSESICVQIYLIIYKIYIFCLCIVSCICCVFITLEYILL